MKVKILLLILITMLVSFSLTSLVYSQFIIQDIRELSMKVKVGDVVGMDVNDTVISFGIIPYQGGSAQRKIMLENMEDKPLRVFVKNTGEMAEWVSASEEKFILDVGEKKELIFTAMPPKGTERGAYYGNARFVFLRDI